MKIIKGLFLSLCILISSLSAAWAVVILESTFKKSGFKEAEDLAYSPEFSSLVYLEGDSDFGSGSWIGNYNGHGYVLTAAHMFSDGVKVADYSYWTMNGDEYEGDALYIHPAWNDNLEDRTGYDFAIVRLSEEVKGVGGQPYLYDGSAEKGMILTFVGYGYRGTGTKGEDQNIDTKDEPAAAVGLIELVEEEVMPAPNKGDAGNYLGVWLPKEDGSIKNPYDDKGITKPISPLTGILGSGDSGGPAWIKTSNGWAIAGINSNGDGNAAYGELSFFPRVSSVRGWILEHVPTARFIH